ncbi:MAG: YibE/F family protein [Gracilibacter sp. BRH_c7a]|nr:MAG: YibE/F family protein [Gracilibacter sp. BRH_c7a]
MTKSNKRFRVYITLLVLIFTLIVFPWPSLAQGEEEILPPEPVTVRGKILEITEDESIEPEPSYGDYEITYFQVMVQVLSGEHKGEIIPSQHVVDDRMLYKLEIEEGDEVLIYLETDESGEVINANIAEIYRQKYLLYLTLIFLLSLTIFGGIKGLKTIVTLAITGLAIIKILLPGLVAGYNPILLTVGICAGITAITLIIVSGLNKKTLAAIIGITGGVLAAGIIAMLFGSLSKLTGLGQQEAQMLLFIPQETGFNFKGLLFAGIIIGALGAVMDVGMSISSSLSEIQTIKPDIGPKELMGAGMNVGRDIMGTMANTLILAYVGASLPLLLLFYANEIPVYEFINWEVISGEIVRALAGSIGLILTIPLTALSVAVLGKNPK